MSKTVGPKYPQEGNAFKILRVATVAFFSDQCPLNRKNMTQELKLPIIDLSSPDRLSTADSIRQVYLDSVSKNPEQHSYAIEVLFFHLVLIVSLLIVFQACMEHGFFYVVNHGVEEELLNRVFLESKKFFLLPLEEKMKLVRKEHRGYTPLYAENLDPSSSNKGFCHPIISN